MCDWGQARWWKFGWAVVALLAASGCGGDDESAAKGPSFDVLDPKGTHFGKTYGEWGAEWWTWIYELPQVSAAQCVLPPDDPTGANCAYGQDPSSPVFFLAGNLGGISVRSDCVVPPGKAVFFPILNYTSDNGGVPPAEQLTESELRAVVEAWIPTVDLASLFAKVDGEPVEDLAGYLAGVTQYEYTVPPEPNTYTCWNVPGVTGLVTPSFTAGYYLMVADLDPGAHTIQFGGSVGAAPPFALDVTYKLTVE